MERSGAEVEAAEVRPPRKVLWLHARAASAAPPYVHDSAGFLADFTLRGRGHLPDERRLASGIGSTSRNGRLAMNRMRGLLIGACAVIIGALPAAVLAHHGWSGYETEIRK